MNTIEDKIIEFYKLKQYNEDLIESNKRQQQMLEQLEKSNHIDLIDVLDNDVQQLALEYNECASQPKRRGLIRAIFAYIEGNIYKIKEEILIEETHKRQPTLYIEEIVVLKEKNYFLNAKGKVRSTTKYSDLFANIKFTLNCYIKSAQIDFILKIDGLERDCLKDSIAVRNRITHPKNAPDLDISENEIIKAFITYLNFRKIMIILFNKKTAKLKEAVPGQIKF